MIKKLGIVILSFLLITFYFYNSGTNRQIFSFDEVKNRQPEVSFYNPLELATMKFDRSYDCNESISSYDELMKNTDSVVLVQMVSRKQLSNVFETKVKVLKNIDGEEINDSEIIVYEPIAYQRDTNMISVDGYLPWMKNNQRYLVFLKKNLVNDYYNFTSSLFGCYCLKQQLNEINLDYCDIKGNVHNINYQTVSNYDLIVFDFQNYLSFYQNDNTSLSADVITYNGMIKSYKELHSMMMKKYYLL